MFMQTSDGLKRYAYSAEDDDILLRRAEELALLRKPAETDVRLMLRMRIAGVEFAIDQKHVRQIISPVSLIPVPFTDPAIKGITHIRGELVSVIDLGELLGAPSISGGIPQHALLLDNRDLPFCLALEQTADTAVVSAEDVMTDESFIIEWARPVIDGMFLSEYGAIGILSIERLNSHQSLLTLLEADGHGA
jgi:chemotaxis signal transduction protein